MTFAMRLSSIESARTTVSLDRCSSNLDDLQTSYYDIPSRRTLAERPASFGNGSLSILDNLYDLW